MNKLAKDENGYYILDDVTVCYNPDTKDIVVLGVPRDPDCATIEDEELAHNCDYTGCTSVCHTLMRGDLNNEIIGL